MEKTQSEVCTDENGIPFLSIKQLSRIEKGENRPSGEVFRYLTQKMGRKIDWNMPMLETDSIQALSIRQDIMYWSGMRQYDKEKDMNQVIAEAKKKESSLNFDVAMTYSKLGDDLYNNTVNAILINTAYNGMFEDNHPDFQNEVKRNMDK